MRFKEPIVETELFVTYQLLDNCVFVGRYIALVFEVDLGRDHAHMIWPELHRVPDELHLAPERLE